jgi:hypothetical protein
MVDREFQDRDERDRMPYWIWVCSRYGPQDTSSQALRLGELFIVTLDRLEQDGIAIQKIIDNISDLIPALTGYEAANPEAYGHIVNFASTLRTNSTIKEYASLRELSQRWLAILERYLDWLRVNRMDTELFLQAITRLQQAITEVAQEFKAGLIRDHTSYFHSDAQLPPIHLGYQLVGLQILELTIRHLRFEPTSTAESDAVRASQESLCSLFDWYGDFAEAEHFYWQQERNNIMGLA